MSNTRFYATGRRKEASARVWVKPGSGAITINGKGIHRRTLIGIHCSSTPLQVPGLSKRRLVVI